ncbi:DUF4452 domain-containing protein [Candidatus Bathyarchaeota archaeon]|nr:DUF4452 domain-containing protein [Candidatus Bathyarchaeota archaeon]
MSAYYYGPQHGHPTPAVPGANTHSHHGRNRRAPRLSVSQNGQRQQFRAPRGGAMKEMPDTTALLTFRTRFEATRSFDLEDDLEFCPNLLTDTDVSCAGSESSSTRSSSPANPRHQLVSIHSASERSSLASSSPDSSPTQQPQSITPSFSLNSSSPPFVPPTSFQSQHVHSLKMQQQQQQTSAAAARGRNAIPIVNPATGAAMSSPSPSVSPARMHHAMGRRW